MVLQHAGGVGRCAKARGMKPVYGVGRAMSAGKLNDSLWLSLKTETSFSWTVGRSGTTALSERPAQLDFAL